MSYTIQSIILISYINLYKAISEMFHKSIYLKMY